ncbi:MAG: light-harvesting antenna LH1, beta subunit [Pseudomonadota bacterium]
MTDVSHGSTLDSSGLTAREAQEFHKFFVMNTAMFTVIALVAHILMLMWRPWIIVG